MLKWLALRIFKIAGWTLTGRLPDLDKAVFIAAPHTSNWDGFWFLTYKFAIDVQVSFLAKDTLFWWPLGTLLRGMGAMPIDRSDATKIVSELVRAFDESDHLYLALAPEGTRKRMPYWKSGFHRIANAANVPIVMAYIDYPNKRMGIGPTLPDGQTVEEDLAAIRQFYAQFSGKRPEMQGPVEFPPE